MNRKLLYVLMVAFVLSWAGCKKNNKQITINALPEQPQENDSTVYGTCGEDTGMSTLQLITDKGDTLEYVTDSDDGSVVKGGLFSGGRMAVVGYKNADGELVATNAINLSTLYGKWTSLDKNFEIEEGGEVKSFQKAEKNPWTSWSILNGKLLLGKDTFDIDVLGPDSLSLENKVGIFVYKRAKN